MTPPTSQKSHTAVERVGVERLDEADRTSTPWTFFVMFLGSSVALGSVIYGWIPITYGLGLWSGLSSLIVGTLIGVVLLIPLMVIGSETATNNATASGAFFGVRGRLIGSFLGLTNMVTAVAVATWTGGGVVIGVLQRLLGTPINDAGRTAVYCVTVLVGALIAIYGYRMLQRAMTVIMIAGGVLLVLMLIAFADRIDLGYAGGAYILDGFWSTWLLSALTVGVGAVLLVSTLFGDWTRYVSPSRFPARKLAPPAALAVFIGYVVPLGVGMLVATAFADPFASFPENLATSAPGWLAVVLVPLALISSLGVTAGGLYSGGLDLDSIVRRIDRVGATTMISVAAVGLVLWCTFSGDASGWIAATSLLLLALIAPWVAIVGIGYLRTRGGYHLDDLQVFNRGEQGGAYWFTGGVHRPAVLAWTAGSIFGLLAVRTSLYVGPLADLAGGFDVSFLGSFVIAGLLYVGLDRASTAGPRPR